MRKLILFISIITVTFALNKAEVTKTGNKASKELFMALSKNLKEKIKSDGFAGAVEFCSSEADKITKAVNLKLPQNVKVKRVSLKVRSAKNAPQRVDKEMLELFDNMKANNIVLTPLIKKMNKNMVKFYKPMVINKPVCLKCHGDSKTIDPKALEAIKKKYPNDRAKDYKLRDLRGAFVVTIKK